MNVKLKAVRQPAASSRMNRSDLLDDLSSTEMIASTHTQELVIALCGPIGSPLHEVASKLEETLRTTFGYDVVTLRLSGYIQAHASRAGQALSTRPAIRRNELISLGDGMRRAHGAAVLAELAVHEIRVGREHAANGAASQDGGSRRICHIVDSIKNQQELELLRTVYRELLYVVGVFAPLPQREAALRHEGLDNAEIATLMDRDSGEELAEGQTVDETFPQCDFFLRMDANTDTQLRSRVERFLNLILGTQVITPTRAETAMYAAASAASNSACLSRQVGAAVTDEAGEVLAIGWNDVPRPFGDLYVTDLVNDANGDQDKRCWNYGGKCHNDEEKDQLAAHVIEALAPYLRDDLRAEAASAVARNKKLRGLIEFSRAIHAEMHAVLTALRQKGDRVRGGKIFVTTYPCHGCARHLVAAGIKEIYFIEPYKKSLAVKLHGDALTESEQAVDKVRLIPYDGVAPTRYLSLFKMRRDSRKRHGRVIRVAADRATPKLEKSLEALPALEGLVIESLRRRSLIEVNVNSSASPSHGPPGHDDPGTAPA